MSQRLHSCANNTNLDTINCDSYSSKLHKGPTNAKKMKTPRERSESRGRFAPPPPPASSNSICPRNKTLVVRQNTTPSIKLDQPSTNVIRKEVFDTATVEVTVKTHSTPLRPKQRSRSNSLSTREPWGKVLKTQTSCENLASTFQNFDPLRTVHFLAKELQAKIAELMPSLYNFFISCLNISKYLFRFICFLLIYKHLNLFSNGKWSAKHQF